MAGPHKGFSNSSLATSKAERCFVKIGPQPRQPDPKEGVGWALGSSSFLHFHHTDTHFLSLRLSWSCFYHNLSVFSLFLLKSCLLVCSSPFSFKSSQFSLLLPTTRAWCPREQEEEESEAVLWSKPQEMGQIHWSCKLHCRILSPDTHCSSQRTKGSRRVHQKRLTGGEFTGHLTISLWVVSWIPGRPMILALLFYAPFI